MLFLYIFVMALTTYLIRMLPLTLFQKKIENHYVKSFLYYVPYTCLTAMTIPAIFYATSSILSGIIGLFVAVFLGWQRKSLPIVALFACLSVFLTEYVLGVF